VTYPAYVQNYASQVGISDQDAYIFLAYSMNHPEVARIRKLINANLKEQKNA